MKFVNWLINLLGNRDKVARTEGGSEKTVKKVRCRRLFCRAMILPITAKKTGGYCMPCWRKKHPPDHVGPRCDVCNKPCPLPVF